jgi:alanyl-tRNA synthetase
MRSEEVRKYFLDYFHQRGHKIMPSSSLIPFDDSSILLTTAGMQQFKKYYTREKDPNQDFGTQRITTIQKCFRTTDIEEIGDETHLTFFEMLGNFSFGPVGNDDPQNFGTDGYFKRSAIHWAYNFIKNLDFNIDYVTVFAGEKNIPFDEDSYKIWQELGFSKEKILARGREDNFWGPTGDEGPCGPTTEIYIDGIEVWNIVFNEYYQDKNGNFTKLQYPGVDTGMGFERLMKILQKAPTIFETDFFEKLKESLDGLTNNKDPRLHRIVLDHLRSSVFLIADGLYPSNLDRGYILRRILRRLTLNLKFLDIKLDKIGDLVKIVIDKYSSFYPELEKFDKIQEVILNEMANFEKTLNVGLREFNKLIKENDDEEKLGEKIFLLYTTYGLPLDISRELLKERNMRWNPKSQDIFNQLFKKHQEISKK